MGVVLPPIGDEFLVFVGEGSAFEEVGVVVEPVVVEAVGVEGLTAVFEDDVLPGFHHLALSVVVGAVAGEREGVALLHAHVSEGAKGVGRLVEVGTVAPHPRALVVELYFSFDDLGVGDEAELVVTEFVGVDEVDAVVWHGLFPFSGGGAFLRRGGFLL